MDESEHENIGRSPNPADTLREALHRLTPEVFSEGKIDVHALKRSLGEEHVIDGGERYRLDWAGKGDAYKLLQTPTTATLRPQREQSVNFDDAEHVFIEGENLESLKALQKAYFGKVKLIYIDPPYNTGNDSFVYPDRFQERKEDYLRRVNDLDDDGTLMREGAFQKNTKESGYYHSSWLSMMLPRLYIARNLLQEDGIILVSIDDNEAANLKLLMDEVFGQENMIAQLVWEKGRKNDAKLFSTGHEYILVYARSLSTLKEQKTIWREPKPGAKEIIQKWFELREKHGDNNYEDQQKELREWYKSIPNNHPSKKLSRYKWIDKWGPWRDRDISWPGGGGPRYRVLHPVTEKPCKVPERGWIYSSHKEMQHQIDLGLVVFRDDHTEPPFRKAHLIPIPEEIPEEQTNEISEEEISEEDIGLQVMGSVLYKQSQASVRYLRNLLGGKYFNNPKDHEILGRLIDYCMGQEKDGVVLDFFAGSGSTIEAVLRLNANDDGNRKTLAVQYPEPYEEKSEAFKAGYKSLSEICRERTKRVIQQIHDDADLASKNQDGVGLKAFKIAPSNFRQWRGDAIGSVEDLAEQIRLFADSTKDGAAVEDMLYELLLKFGQELTAPIEILEIAGTRVFTVDEGTLAFVLDGFNEAMIPPLMECTPREIIALDTLFTGNDQLKSNLELQCRDASIKLVTV